MLCIAIKMLLAGLFVWSLVGYGPYLGAYVRNHPSDSLLKFKGVFYCVWDIISVLFCAGLAIAECSRQLLAWNMLA